MIQLSGSALDVQQEIERLKDHTITLGNMSKNALQRGVWSLKERDCTAARLVLEQEEKVNTLTDQIGDDCVAFIARFQPLGLHLRTVTSILLMIRDMERIADYGKNIARESLSLIKIPPLKPLIDIPRMSEHVGEMMDLCLQAMSDGDAQKTLSVFPMDDDVDDHQEQILRELIFIMMQHPDKIDQAYRLLNISRILERAGDHTTNIAEHVYFICTGSRIHASDRRRAQKTTE